MQEIITEQWILINFKEEKAKEIVILRKMEMNIYSCFLADSFSKFDFYIMFITQQIGYNIILCASVMLSKILT